MVRARRRPFEITGLAFVVEVITGLGHNALEIYRSLTQRLNQLAVLLITIPDPDKLLFRITFGTAFLLPFWFYHFVQMPFSSNHYAALAALLPAFFFPFNVVFFFGEAVFFFGLLLAIFLGSPSGGHDFGRLTASTDSSWSS